MSEQVYSIGNVAKADWDGVLKDLFTVAQDFATHGLSVQQINYMIQCNTETYVEFPWIVVLEGSKINTSVKCGYHLVAEDEPLPDRRVVPELKNKPVKLDMGATYGDHWMQKKISEASSRDSGAYLGTFNAQE